MKQSIYFVNEWRNDGEKEVWKQIYFFYKTEVIEEVNFVTDTFSVFEQDGTPIIWWKWHLFWDLGTSE